MFSYREQGKRRSTNKKKNDQVKRRMSNERKQGEVRKKGKVEDWVKRCVQIKQKLSSRMEIEQNRKRIREIKGGSKEVNMEGGKKGCKE